MNAYDENGNLLIGVECTIKHPEDFLLVKESLTRMGVAHITATAKTLYQTAHILHSRGKYYICHFKELFALDSRPVLITADDYARRNLITSLLQDWNLITVNDVDIIKVRCSMADVKVLSYRAKQSWELVPKYTLGGNRHGK